MKILKNYNKFDFYMEDMLVLEEAGVYVNVRGAEAELMVSEISEDYIVYKNEKHGLSAVLRFCESECGVTINAEAEFIQKSWMEPVKTFDSEEGLYIKFRMPKNNGFFSKYMQGLFWSYVDFKTIPEKTQGVLINTDVGNICILPVCGENAKAELESETDFVKLTVKTDMSGFACLASPILCISMNTDPYKAIEDAILTTSKTDYFLTPLKTNKDIPDFIKYLGWCTWNAFYHDVTAEKIEQKLKEFKEKNIPVKWVLIDDGWFCYDNEKLESLEADKNKFPMGLDKFISHIKREYDIKYVGVWHAFNGYWGGIDKNSRLYDDLRNIVRDNNSGIITTDFCDEEKSYKFFSKWHTYLKNSGVDFIKVDVQGGIMRICEYESSPVSAARVTHNALERSVKENFRGGLINCMGMDMINTASRKASSIIRNSDDFFPDREGGFKKHLIQNAYNSVFNRSLYMCDFDMWWSMHESAVQSAVLRAISGGPIYVSDKVGESDAEMFKPLCNADGTVIMCDDNPVPSPDCMFRDFISENTVLKLMNSVGEISVVAAFNVSAYKRLEYILSVDDIMLKNADEYVCYSYFEKKFYRLSKDVKLEFSLDGNGVEIFNIYPVSNGTIMLGDTSKYINGGTVREERKLTDLNKQKVIDAYGFE